MNLEGAIAVSWIVAVVFLVMFFKSPLPGAMAEGIRRRHAVGDAGLGRHLEELTGEVHALRDDVNELAERLDFTERMLADVRRRGALPG